MAKFLEYLGIALIGVGLALVGISSRDPAYWCFVFGIALYVKFGGGKND